MEIRPMGELMDEFEDELKQKEISLTPEQRLARSRRESEIKDRDQEIQRKNEQHEKDHPEMYGDDEPKDDDE